MNQHTTDLLGFSIDVINPKQFETVFPAEIVSFHTDLNFTTNEEDVFQLMVNLAKECGFCGVVYEYCADVFATEPDHFMRTSLPKAFIDMERLAKCNSKPGYGRAHSVLKWTPSVGGSEFSDYFQEYPSQVWKYRISSLMLGLRSGFGIPLRSSDPNTWAGFGFVSKMKRQEFEAALQKHGWALHAASWAAHVRISQHAESRLNKPELTDRQLDYLKLLAEGLLDKQIAHAMDISHSAVRKHQYAVSRRLNVQRRGEIVPTAIRFGLLINAQSQSEPRAAWDFKLS